MKKKLLFALVVVLLATLITATPALAYYSSVSGTVLNSKTKLPWTHGGTVDVWDCGSIHVGPPLGTGTILADGTFTASGISGPPSFGYLCVEITFTCTDPECVATPLTKWLVIPSTGGSDEGDYNAGTIYTDTGPNVVTLADANAQSPNRWVAVAVAAVALVGAGGVVLLLRRRRVA